MAMTEENRGDLIDLYWQKSVSTFEEVLLGISAQRWNWVANRIYYSTFYALSAMLIKDAYPIKSHRGAKAVFTKNYVLTGAFDKKYGTLFSKLETLRDKADYDVSFAATKEMVDEFKPLVEELLTLIKNRLDS